MTPRIAGIVGLAGVLGWAGLIWLAARMYGTTPPTAAFDLELLLRAGREVAAGRSPYDPAMLAGAAPVAERLFYSYPPVVAQAISLVASVPSAAMFVVWTIAAVIGLAAVTRLLAARYASTVAGSPLVVAAIVVALVPLMFPLAIGLLFGNLDVFFPLLYGLVLIGVGPRANLIESAAGGVAAAIAALTKLHPASLVLWLLVRARFSRQARRAFAAAIVVGLFAIGVSFLIGGTQPWIDYVAVVRAGSGADLVDPRNAGPAAQVAMLLLGSGTGAESLARTLQIPVSLIALLITGLAAARLADPVESLAWAAAASLVVLPVTWYHYPSALIPFAIAAVLRSVGMGDAGRQVRILVIAAAVTAALALAWLPLIYVAIGLTLFAVHLSADAVATSSARESPTAVREPTPG